MATTTSYDCYELVDTGEIIPAEIDTLFSDPETSKKSDEEQRIALILSKIVECAKRCHIDDLDLSKLKRTCLHIEVDELCKKLKWPADADFLPELIHTEDQYPLIATPDGQIYIDIKEIGAGVFKRVHLGIDYHSRRPVALAKMRQTKRETDPFEHERAVIARIKGTNAPGLIEVYGVYAAKVGDRLIVSRYYCGGDLAFHIQKKTLTIHERFTILLDLVRGVKFLHGKNIVHRDIKPENVLLTYENQGQNLLGVALTDFGSSSAMSGSRRFRNFMVEKRHSPPEVHLENRKRKHESIWFDPAYDVWSLGITVLRMYRQLGYLELPWEPYINPLKLAELRSAKNRASQLIDSSIPDRVRSVAQLMLKPSFHDRISLQTCYEMLTS